MLQQCLKVLAPSACARARLGGFRPLKGAALSCIHKAKEGGVTVYLLEGEMLVKEGSKVLSLPY